MARLGRGDVLTRRSTCFGLGLRSHAAASASGSGFVYTPQRLLRARASFTHRSARLGRGLRSHAAAPASGAGFVHTPQRPLRARASFASRRVPHGRGLRSSSLPKARGQAAGCKRNKGNKKNRSTELEQSCCSYWQRNGSDGGMAPAEPRTDQRGEGLPSFGSRARRAGLDALRPPGAPSVGAGNRHAQVPVAFLSASMVVVPTLPSPCKPLAHWKRLTAMMVRSPNLPSTEPL